jgi:hypothetical protein
MIEKYVIPPIRITPQMNTIARIQRFSIGTPKTLPSEP